MASTTRLPIGKYEIPPIFGYFYSYDDKFIKLLYGSRSSGKTDVAVLKKLRRCLELKYFKCLLVRRIKSNVRSTLYSKVKSVAKRKGIDHLFEFRDHAATIVCKENGNSFMPMGTYEVLGNTGTSKGTDDPTDALVDEMDEITEKEWNDLVKSIRGSNDLEIVGIFNTKIVNEDHWIYKKFFPEGGTETFERKDGLFSYVPSRRSNTSILHSTYLDNHYTTKQQIGEFEEDRLNDPEEYGTNGLGLLKAQKHKNLAIPNFRRSTHIDDSIVFDPSIVCYLSWDFNNLPHHTVSMWQFGGHDMNDNTFKMNMVKEFCLPDHSVTKVQQEINKYLRSKGYQPRKIRMMCDWSGKKMDDENRSLMNNIVSTIGAGGYTAENLSRPNPSVIPSIDFLNDIFGDNVRANTYGDSIKSNNHPIIIFRVHPQCKFHIADFEKTKTGADGRLLKVKKREMFVEDGISVPRTYEIRGHGVDNSRYFAVAIFEKEYNKHKSQNR